MRKLSNLTVFLVLIIISGGIIVLQSASIVSAVQSNIAWVKLNRQIGHDNVTSQGLRNEQDAFARATGLYAGNKSAWFGLGVTYALQQKVDEAISTWRKSESNPAALIEHGLHDRRNQNMDIALTQFRAANALESSPTNEAHYLAGTVCQRTLANPDLLSAANRQYCSEYFKNNRNNWIINGSFAEGSLVGWGGAHFFAGRNAARLALEQDTASADTVVSLKGLDESNHFGLFQRLTLSPGNKVIFRGRFKLSGKPNLTARILYIAWQDEDGTVQGNHGEQHSNNMQWTKFERSFTVPPNIQPAIDFYPVLFSGEGTVWFDDIQLELNHE